MPAREPRLVQVLVAVPSPIVARRISESLLERRLCACAQTLAPMTSRYRWRGKIESAREWLLVLKTRAALFPALERAVRELHPYDVPEILALHVDDAHAGYGRWLMAETSARRSPVRRRAPVRRAGAGTRSRAR